MNAVPTKLALCPRGLCLRGRMVKLCVRLPDNVYPKQQYGSHTADANAVGLGRAEVPRSRQDVPKLNNLVVMIAVTCISNHSLFTNCLVEWLFKEEPARYSSRIYAIQFGPVTRSPLSNINTGSACTSF